MNVWIASDIHGSALYCRKLLDLMEKRGADRLVLLGDLLYHGPRNDLPEGYDPKAVFAMLNSVKDRILCVHGNCDAEVDQMVQYPPYQTNARTSPPTWSSRAFLSVMTPLDVEMIAMPRPRSTRGSSSAPT